MLQDLHSHTYYSYCGKDSPETLIKAAIKNGVETLGITDHYYGIVMNKKGFEYPDDEMKISMHSNALKRYYDHIKTLAYIYRDHINVKCGVEISAVDWGAMLLPDGVDVSYFDYCLVEYLNAENAVVSDLFEFAKRLGSKYVGIAHLNLPQYLKTRDFDIETYFKKMAENNIFWELNVNRDSIHNYREHAYVNEFFENTDIIDIVKRTGVTLSVGFDSHIIEEYDVSRVKYACSLLEKLSIPMLKLD
ncbi:MAG: PHP domain-containing protein [Clostridia bacterium]|nr:PHP domain-containing protein [Clostridia bacterium]